MTSHSLSKSLLKQLALPLLVTLLVACGPSPSSAPPAAEATAAPIATEAPETPDDTTNDTDGSDTNGNAPPAESSALPSGTRTYIIVPAESSASYIVEEEFFGLALGKYGIPEGLVNTVGTTSAIEGQFQLNWDDLSAPLGENTFTVDLSTLESNQRLRDNWIRDEGPEFGTYPNATFVAESLEGAPTSYTPGEEVTFQLVGQLTIRETTQPATFDVTASLLDGTVSGTAVAALVMSDFGIAPPDFANTLTVADNFRIEVTFTAREQ